MIASKKIKKQERLIMLIAVARIVSEIMIVIGIMIIVYFITKRIFGG